MTLLMMVVGASAANYGPKQVAETELQVPHYEAIEIEEHAKFLNDLMLSPHWGVTRDRNGNYVANPRTNKDMTGSYGAVGYTFKQTQIAQKPQEARWSAQIIFTPPREGTVILEPGASIRLPIYDVGNEQEIGLNSHSMVAVRLSQQPEAYLTLRESGEDTTRSTTLQYLPLMLEEVRAILKLPESYKTTEVYTEFYHAYFESTTEDHGLKRTEGIQGRDNFYGYFRAKSGQNYDGINIKISHPIFCPVEGTRESSRRQKAEFPGTPYVENDLIFYLIEDNAVYLSGEYDERFGFFTGNESFEGKIEVLNMDQELLLESSGPFTGWQR